MLLVPSPIRILIKISTRLYFVVKCVNSHTTHIGKLSKFREPQKCLLSSHPQKNSNFILSNWQVTFFHLIAFWQCPKTLKFLTARPSNGNFCNYSLLCWWVGLTAAHAIQFALCFLSSYQCTNCKLPWSVLAQFCS